MSLVVNITYFVTAAPLKSEFVSAAPWSVAKKRSIRLKIGFTLSHAGKINGQELHRPSFVKIPDGVSLRLVLVFSSVPHCRLGNRQQNYGWPFEHGHYDMNQLQIEYQDAKRDRDAVKQKHQACRQYWSG